MLTLESHSLTYFSSTAANTNIVLFKQHLEIVQFHIVLLLYYMVSFLLVRTSAMTYQMYISNNFISMCLIKYVTILSIIAFV